MKEIITQKEKIDLKRNMNSIILPIKKEDYNDFITDKIKAKEIIKNYFQIK